MRYSGFLHYAFGEDWGCRSAIALLAVSYKAVVLGRGCFEGKQDQATVE